MTLRSQTQGPTNIDLINILRKRIDKNKRPSFITDMQNLYEKEPWLLQHVRYVSFVENLWFYFVTRKQCPANKKSDSKRPNRKVAESGRWKTTGNLYYIENKDGVRVGSMKTISFKTNTETVKDEITTGWVMHEFVLDKPGFQELALCRIRFYPRKDNAQYTPRLIPIVIGLEREEGMEINQAQGMEQYQEFRSYIQQHNHKFGHMEGYGQGFGDMVEYKNRYLGQQKNHILGQQATYVSLMKLVENNSQHHLTSIHYGVFAPVETHQVQGMEQRSGSCSGKVVSNLALQHQQDSNYPILNGCKDQHQSVGSCGRFLGESSGQQQHIIRGRQATYLSLMEVEQQQCHNYFWGQETVRSHSSQAKEQCNGYSGLYSPQPYFQGMMDHQKIGSSALSMSQENEYLSYLPFTQQQNVSCSAQPYDQYKGQNNELPTIPMKTHEQQQQQQNNELPRVPLETQQQQDNFVTNSAAELHLQAQDNVPLIDQTMEAQATDPSTDSQKHQELLGDDFISRPGFIRDG